MFGTVRIKTKCAKIFYMYINIFSCKLNEWLLKNLLQPTFSGGLAAGGAASG